MDLVHSWGVELAVYLQTTYSSYQDWLNLASTVADLHTTFFVFFPIWFHLRRDTGLRLIWVGVLGDWLNLVLKWVLFGERPYWWVHETRFYGAGPAPVLQQFPITCETGPGSPSGHAMAAAAVWYVMVTALLSLAAEKQCPPLLYKFSIHSTKLNTNSRLSDVSVSVTACMSLIVPVYHEVGTSQLPSQPDSSMFLVLTVALWVLMMLVAVVVCMSRVFMAAHFPHQVIAGVITGVLVAEFVSKQRWIYHASMKRYFYTTLFLTSFAVGFYLLLKAVGVDLLWTLQKAEQWCVRPEWVHLDTTPFASLLRNMGTLFGLGLGLHSHFHMEKQGLEAKTSFKMGCMTLSVFVLQLFDRWTFPHENLVVFHLLSFVKSAVVPLIPTTLVPWALCWICMGKQADKKL